MARRGVSLREDSIISELYADSESEDGDLFNIDEEDIIDDVSENECVANYSSDSDSANESGPPVTTIAESVWRKVDFTPTVEAFIVIVGLNC